MNLVTWAGWREGRVALRWISDRASETFALQAEVRLGVGPKACVGAVVDGERQMCTSGRPPSGRQCFPCASLDTFRPCMICTGFQCPRLSTAMKARCEGLHHLYLASFGGQTVKVGTASKGRHDARLVEQGPLAAMRIASGAGPRIKQMEHLLSTKTHLVEAVRRSRKLAHLSGGGDVLAARANLLEAHGLAVELLSSDYGEELHPLEWFVPVDLADASRMAAVGRTAAPVEEGSLIRGTVVGAVGPIVLLDDGPARLLLDVGSLVGRLVDPHPPADSRVSTVQLGLFA